jgi:iron complex transport system substrate-binding protein
MSSAYRGYRRALMLPGLALVVLLLSACRADGRPETAVVAPTVEVTAPARTPAPSPANPLTYTDATGATVTLPRPAERIVCLAGPCVDILAELDLLPVAWNQARVGQDAAFFGPRGMSVARVSGSFDQPNLEDIAKAQPDLVIGLSVTHGGLREALTAIAPLMALDPKHYREAVENLHTVGRLTGRTAEATAAASRFERKLEAYRSRSPRTVTALKMWGTGTLFGIDPVQSLYGSVLSEVTRYPWPAPAGVTPASDGRVAYSLERILEGDPQQIFIADLDAGFGNAPPFTDQFKDNPIWRNISAVKDGRVESVNTAVWLNARGTRGLRTMLDQAMPKLYPSVFPTALPD